jgi:hypothetical protein
MMAYTNGFESLWSHFKRDIPRINHWVKGHLKKYVNEYSLKYKIRKPTQNLEK